VTTSPPTCDIDRSPTLLLASLFAARRSGDELLARLLQRRLTALGISVTFAALPATEHTEQPDQDPAEGGR
jgi:hypothetical protein